MNKDKLRSFMKERRKNISIERRKVAEKTLEKFFFENIDKTHKILSFYPFQSEISLKGVNEALSSLGNLFLPKMINGALQIFKVDNLDTDVEKNHFEIFEPIPDKCTEVPITFIDCIFVPGLAFDDALSRLGYGKGFYDKLLENYKGISIGLGFKEQKVKKVPTENYDQTLNQVHLF